MSGSNTEARSRVWLDYQSLIVEKVGEDGLWYGQFGHLIVVPALAPFRTYTGRSSTRLGQSVWYGWMSEPRLE
ncbi:hypothetical protein F2Q70_00002658 [Brassica cretica]|uniref:Uncharacterized protein n=1 Tax=Brassica cretica TaxID=69181 RepID=A0A8S9J074_BRACR|nr:hypothetical protein F2Q70_00002658 [Brassica cretica]